LSRKILFLSNSIPHSYLFWKLGNACIRRGSSVYHVSEGPYGFQFLSQKGVRVKYLHSLPNKKMNMVISEDDFKRLSKHETALYKDQPFLQKKVRKLVPKTIARWHSFLGMFCPDDVVINNGSGLANESLVYTLAHINPEVRIWCSENGFVPNTFYLDKGTNANSSLMDWDIDMFQKYDPRTAEFLDNFTSEKINPRPTDWEPLKGFQKAISLAMWYPTVRLLAGRRDVLGYREFMANRHLKQIKFKDPDLRLLRPYVFIPLQVARDTQVLHNSEYIHDMLSLVRFVARNIPSDKFRIVVKDHPIDRAVFPFERFRGSLEKEFNNIVFVRNTPSIPLSRMAEAVVTINSTVGWEAVLCRKPVFCLGRAWYAKPGVANSVSSQDDFASLFESLWQVVPDDKRLIPLASYVLFKYLLAGNYHNITDEESDIAVARILEGSVPLP
jgi:capsular polysaccharide export protein